MARRRLEVEIVGDATRLNRTLGQTETRLTRFGRTVDRTSKGGGLAGILGGGRGLIGGTALAVGLAKTVSAANEAAVTLGQTKVAVESLGISWQQNARMIEGAADDISRAASIDDEEVLRSFQVLVRGAGDVDTAFDRVALAADLARGRYISLEQATMIVNKAAMGQVGALRRVGIQIDKNASATEALAALERNFAGAAEQYSQEHVAAVDRMRVAWENLGEKIGGPVTTALAVFAEKSVSALDSVGNAFDRLTGRTDQKGWNLTDVGGQLMLIPPQTPIPGPDEGTRGTPGRLDGRATPGGPLPKVSGLSPKLQEQILNARLQGTDEALLKALRAARGSLSAAAGDPRLTQKQRMAVKSALLQITGEITGITDGMAAEAEAAKQDAKDAAEDAANARQEARDKRKRARDEAKRKREEADRRRQEAIEAAAEAAEEFARKMEERADNLKSAALRALDRIKERRDFGRSMSDALEQLALARRIGSPTAVKNAQGEIADLRLDKARMMLEDAKVTSLAGGQGPRGRLLGGGGFQIHMPGATIVANNPQELAKALQRMARTAPSNRRGPYAGTRTGI